MGNKALIKECLELLRTLEKEFPGELDLEALHSVTGVYADLKSYHDKINTFPGPVRAFCEFLHTAKRSEAELANFLAFLTDRPGALYSDENETFLEKRRRIAGIAEQAGSEPSQFFHLISMARLKGILDRKDILVDDYKRLISDYLDP